MQVCQADGSYGECMGCGASADAGADLWVADLSAPDDIAAPDLGPDLGVDLTPTGMNFPPQDMATTCTTVPMTGDGTSCAATSCPGGQAAVLTPAGCVCYFKCDPAAPSQCSCDRRCVALTDADGGAAGGACLPGLTAGLRCGSGVAQPCAQTLTCAGATGAAAYCVYPCSSQADCPAQTNCVDLVDGNGATLGKACAYSYGAGGIATASACSANDVCTTSNVCDVNAPAPACLRQCEGPNDSTTCPGECSVLLDKAKGKTIAYVCRPKFDPDIEADIENLGCTASVCHGGTQTPVLKNGAVDANYTNFTAEAMTGASSPVLTKNLQGSGVTHGGGSKFQTTADSVYRRWLSWIAAGNPK